MGAAILVVLVLMAGLYAAGVARAWRSAGAARGVSAGAVLCFVAGLATLLVALFALDEPSDERFAWHMLQHELLMAVAPPLLALSDVPIALAWLAPGGLRRLMARARHATRQPRLPGAALASLVQAAALWAWHIPVLFDLAQAHEAVHAAQHLSFFLTALWFWRSLSHGRFSRLGFGAAVLYLFAASVQSGALGALLVFSPRPWYAAGSAVHSPIEALEDQQLAGLLMWVPASLVFLAAGLLYLSAWLNESERRAALIERPLAREVSSEVAVSGGRIVSWNELKDDLRW